MPARCLHYSEWCDNEENRECHYVISFKNTLVILATRALEIDQMELPHQIGEHIRKMESLLADMGRPL
jgi:hypothetical protein